MTFVVYQHQILCEPSFTVNGLKLSYRLPLNATTIVRPIKFHFSLKLYRVCIYKFGLALLLKRRGDTEET